MLLVTVASTALAQLDPRREAPASIMATVKDWVTSRYGKAGSQRQETGSIQQIVPSPALPYGLFWRLLGSTVTCRQTAICVLLLCFASSATNHLYLFLTGLAHFLYSFKFDALRLHLVPNRIFAIDFCLRLCFQVKTNITILWEIIGPLWLPRWLRW